MNRTFWKRKPKPTLKPNAVAEADTALMDEFVPCLNALLPDADPTERLRQMRIIWQHVYTVKKRLEVERDTYEAELAERGG